MLNKHWPRLADEKPLNASNPPQSCTYAALVTRSQSAIPSQYRCNTSHYGQSHAATAGAAAAPALGSHNISGTHAHAQVPLAVPGLTHSLSSLPTGADADAAAGDSKHAVAANMHSAAHAAGRSATSFSYADPHSAASFDVAVAHALHGGGGAGVVDQCAHSFSGPLTSTAVGCGAHGLQGDSADSVMGGDKSRVRYASATPRVCLDGGDPQCCLSGSGGNGGIADGSYAENGAVGRRHSTAVTSSGGAGGSGGQSSLTCRSKARSIRYSVAHSHTGAGAGAGTGSTATAAYSSRRAFSADGHDAALLPPRHLTVQADLADPAAAAAAAAAGGVTVDGAAPGAVSANAVAAAAAATGAAGNSMGDDAHGSLALHTIAEGAEATAVAWGGGTFAGAGSSTSLLTATTVPSSGTIWPPTAATVRDTSRSVSYGRRNISAFAAVRGRRSSCAAVDLSDSDYDDRHVESVPDSVALASNAARPKGSANSRRASGGSNGGDDNDEDEDKDDTFANTAVIGDQSFFAAGYKAPLGLDVNDSFNTTCLDTARSGAMPMQSPSVASSGGGVSRMALATPAGAAAAAAAVAIGCHPHANVAGQSSSAAAASSAAVAAAAAIAAAANRADTETPSSSMLRQCVSLLSVGSAPVPAHDDSNSSVAANDRTFNPRVPTVPPIAQQQSMHQAAKTGLFNTVSTPIASMRELSLTANSNIGSAAAALTGPYAAGTTNAAGGGGANDSDTDDVDDGSVASRDAVRTGTGAAGVLQISRVSRAFTATAVSCASVSNTAAAQQQQPVAPSGARSGDMRPVMFTSTVPAGAIAMTAVNPARHGAHAHAHAHGHGHKHCHTPTAMIKPSACGYRCLRVVSDESLNSLFVQCCIDPAEHSALCFTAKDMHSTASDWNKAFGNIDSASADTAASCNAAATKGSAPKTLTGDSAALYSSLGINTMLKHENSAHRSFAMLDGARHWHFGSHVCSTDGLKALCDELVRRYRRAKAMCSAALVAHVRFMCGPLPLLTAGLLIDFLHDSPDDFWPDVLGGTPRNYEGALDESDQREIYARVGYHRSQEFLKACIKNEENDDKTRSAALGTTEQWLALITGCTVPASDDRRTRVAAAVPNTPPTPILGTGAALGAAVTPVLSRADRVYTRLAATDATMSGARTQGGVSMTDSPAAATVNTATAAAVDAAGSYLDCGDDVDVDALRPGQRGKKKSATKALDFDEGDN